MKQTRMWFGVALTIASLAVATTTGLAGTRTWTFDTTHPTNEGILLFGSAEWRQSGGNPTGYLSITDAVGSQQARLLFPDIDDGALIQGFTFEADLRVGGGDNPPADGFSISYARENDPVSVNPSGGAFAASPTGEGNLPEEGTQTGLAIGFDEWPSGGSDVRGFSVRVDNVILQEIPLATINGALEDVTSLQTGPQNPNRDPSDITTSWAELGWAKFRVELDLDGRVSLFWKGHQYLTNYQTTFFPSPGRLVFAGRTGGNNGNHHVDNMVLTTFPATTFFISGLTGRGDGIRVNLTEVPGSTLDESTINLRLNDELIPLNQLQVSRQGDIATILYSILPEFLPVGATYTVAFEAQDNNGNSITATRPFTIPRYIVLDPDWRAPAGSYDAANQGFHGYIHQQAVARDAADPPNNLVWSAARQLAGGYLDPVTGQPYANLVDSAGGFGGVNADGTFEYPDNQFSWDPFLNLNELANAEPPGAEVGSFRNDPQPLIGVVGGFPDQAVPGIPGTTGSTDNYVLEAYTYLALTGPSMYTFVVNSDDGFRVTAGPELRNIISTNWLGQFNGGKGHSDVSFDVAVPEGASGVYRFRLLWWEGGSDSSLEFFELRPDGTKVLVGNDGALNPNGLNAYKAATTGQPFSPALVSVTPWPGQTGIRPDTQIQVILADGTGAAVDGNSIVVAVNGVDFNRTVTRIGDKTRVTASPDGLLDGGVVNNVAVTWTAGGNTRTDSWSFTTLAYQALPEWLARPLGSGTNPGFTATFHQLDTLNDQTTLTTRWHARDQQLEGLFGPSVLSVTAPVTLNLINLDAPDDSNPLPAGGTGFFNTNSTPSRPDTIIPGIPSSKASRFTDDIAMEAVTYIEFPTEGFYYMGVNSDDGFRVIVREKWQRLPLKIESPASLFPNGWVGAVSQAPVNNDTESPLPVPPVQAAVIAAAPLDASTDLTNAAEVNGKIALIYRGRTPDGDPAGAIDFITKIARARTAGAAGVIMVNNLAQSDTAARIPPEMGHDAANATIPAVMVMKTDGDIINNALADGTVTASLGGDPLPSLGFYNGGRGQGTATMFGFQITKPGVYPFRMVWFEGGGGANVEWFIQTATGTQVLINDPDNAAGLKAFRNAPPVDEPTEAQFNPPTITDGQVTLTWTGDGTLQESADLSGWSAVTPQPTGQSYTVTPNGSNPAKFYRIQVQ